MSEEPAVEPEPTEVERLNKQLAEMRAMMEALKESIEPFAIAQKEIKSEIDVHKKAITELNEKSFEIEKLAREAKAKLRTLDYDITKAARELKLAETAEILRGKYAALQREFDDIIAGAPWREFAYDYQVKGAKVLASAKKGFLGDKMGLGKSLTSLVWLDLLKSKKVIVILPKESADNYLREVKRWAPSRIMYDLTSRPKAQRDMVLDFLQYQDEFILVLNFEAWRRDNDLIDGLIRLRADSLIIDEAHLIKNSKTNAARGVTAVALAQNQCPVCKAAYPGNGPCIECKFDGGCPQCYAESLVLAELEKEMEPEPDENV